MAKSPPLGFDEALGEMVWEWLGDKPHKILYKNPETVQRCLSASPILAS